MPQSQLKKDQTKEVVWQEDKSGRLSALSAVNTVEGFQLVLRLPNRGFIEIDNMWLNWGIRGVPVNIDELTLWLAEGEAKDFTSAAIPPSADSLDKNAHWMDTQFWIVGSPVDGFQQSYGEGSYIDFDPDKPLGFQNEDGDQVLGFYSLTSRALKFGIIYILSMRTTLFQRMFKDDPTELDFGSPWEELAQELM